MKMFKRVLAGMMMATLMLASVMSVSAADSKGNVIYPAASNNGAYELSEGAEKFKGIDQKVIDVINKVNKNDFTSLDKAIQDKIAGKGILGPMVDVDAVGNHSTTCPPHKVTLAVDSLTTKCTEVVVLHYSQARGVWEVLTPTSIDYDAKTMVVEFQDLSPVTVLAKGVEAGSTGTSPSTAGVNYSWMLWVAVAFVAVGAGLVVSQKKSR